MIELMLRKLLVGSIDLCPMNRQVVCCTVLVKWHPQHYVSIFGVESCMGKTFVPIPTHSRGHCPHSNLTPTAFKILSSCVFSCLLHCIRNSNSNSLFVKELSGSNFYWHTPLLLKCVLSFMSFRFGLFCCWLAAYGTHRDTHSC